MIDYLENDTKYLKKKESSTSKSSEKSNHKHEYKQCLIVSKDYFYPDYDQVTPYHYCTVCGKIKSVKGSDERAVKEGTRYRLLHTSEIIKRYKNRPCFRVEPPFGAKKIDLEKDLVDTSTLKIRN